MDRTLASFIIAGIVVLAVTEVSAMRATGRRSFPFSFMFSIPWYALRVGLIVATVVLCLITLESR